MKRTENRQKQAIWRSKQKKNSVEKPPNITRTLEDCHRTDMVYLRPTSTCHSTTIPGENSFQIHWLSLQLKERGQIMSPGLLGFKYLEPTNQTTWEVLEPTKQPPFWKKRMEHLRRTYSIPITSAEPRMVAPSSQGRGLCSLAMRQVCRRAVTWLDEKIHRKTGLKTGFA